MRVTFNLSALSQTKTYEYAIRFLFGGAITTLAGILAKQFGPVIGGLFLAFPAIFPASATLLEKHQREKKKKAGIAETIRGRQAAALDAYGAALGCVGLACFAVIVWRLLKFHGSIIILCTALVGWTITSLALWRIGKSRLVHGRT
jgi:hypothetical protein